MSTASPPTVYTMEEMVLKIDAEPQRMPCAQIIRKNMNRIIKPSYWPLVWIRIRSSSAYSDGAIAGSTDSTFDPSLMQENTDGDILRPYLPCDRDRQMFEAFVYGNATRRTFDRAICHAGRWGVHSVGVFLSPAPLDSSLRANGHTDWNEMPEYYAGKAIPWAIFCREGEWDSITLEEMIISLQNHSLVALQPGTGTQLVQMHPLVRGWVRSCVPELASGTYQSAAVLLLSLAARNAHTLASQYLASHVSHMSGIMEFWAFAKNEAESPDDCIKRILEAVNQSLREQSGTAVGERTSTRVYYATIRLVGNVKNQAARHKSTMATAVWEAMLTAAIIPKIFVHTDSLVDHLNNHFCEIHAQARPEFGNEGVCGLISLGTGFLAPRVQQLFSNKQTWFHFLHMGVFTDYYCFCAINITGAIDYGRLSGPGSISTHVGDYMPKFSGSYSTVHLGSFNGDYVAIKAPKAASGENSVKRNFLREITAWAEIHRNIHSFYGFANDKEANEGIYHCTGQTELLERLGERSSRMQGLPALASRYVERKRPMSFLEKAMFEQDGHTRLGSKRVVVTGIGGCGKTQLVRRFVDLHEHRYTLITFLDGSNQAALDVGIERYLGDTGHKQPDVIATPPQRSINGERLIIVDNVDDPRVDLKPLLSLSEEVTVIITRRDPLFGRLRLTPTAHLHLDVMSPEEAVELLLPFSKQQPRDFRHDVEAAASIAKELGYHPIALIQSRSFMDAKGYSPVAYISLLRASRTLLLGQNQTENEYAAFAAFDAAQPLGDPRLKFREHSPPSVFLNDVTGQSFLQDFPSDFPDSTAAPPPFRQATSKNRRSKVPRKVIRIDPPLVTHTPLQKRNGRPNGGIESITCFVCPPDEQCCFSKQPCEYFDLMGGVGIGGLLAILLGRLQMNVDEATEALLDLLVAIFQDNAPDFDPETRTGQLTGWLHDHLGVRNPFICFAKCGETFSCSQDRDLHEKIIHKMYQPKACECYKEVSSKTQSLPHLLSLPGREKFSDTEIDKLIQVSNLYPEEKAILERPGIQRLECGPPLQEYMRGTREDILEKIKDYMNDFTAPNIFWLRGIPGRGKSAVATKLVEQLATGRRLELNCFFQRQEATVLIPSVLWRTVAQDLNGMNATMREFFIAELELQVDPMLASEDVPTNYKGIAEPPSPDALDIMAVRQDNWLVMGQNDTPICLRIPYRQFVDYINAEVLNSSVSPNQFLAHPRKPLQRLLMVPYGRAQRLLNIARTLGVFQAQSLHVARQALHLVILLNDVIDEEKGPNDEQRKARIDLGDDLMKLEDAMKEWGRMEGAKEDYHQRLSEIRGQYAQFFKQRFYFNSNNDHQGGWNLANPANLAAYSKDAVAVEKWEVVRSAANILYKCTISFDRTHFRNISVHYEVETRGSGPAKLWMARCLLGSHSTNSIWHPNQQDAMVDAASNMVAWIDS